MGETRASKETQRVLAERDAKAEADRQRLVAKAEEKSPAEQAVEGARLRDVKYFESPTPDYSVPPPGMIDTNLFVRAALNRQRDRMGTGGAQMGAYGADPNLIALNRERADRAAADEGAGAYAGQLAARRAEAFGGAEGLMNFQTGRALNLAGIGSSTAANAQNARVNFKAAPSLWSQLALAAVSGGSQIASAYAGKP